MPEKGKEIPVESENPEKSSFQLGQMVVVPPHGPGRIESISTRPGPIGDEPHLVIAFPAGHKLTLAESESEEDLRLVVEAELAEQALELLRKPEITADKRAFEERFEDRMATVRSGELLRMAGLLRTQYAARGDMSPGEQTFTENLELQVLTEIACVLELQLTGLQMEMGHRYPASNPVEEQESSSTVSPTGPSTVPPTQAPKDRPQASAKPTGPPAVPCHLHPKQPATDSCAKCLKPVCEVCAVADSTRFLCPQCMHKTRKVRRLIQASLALIVIGGLTAVLTWFLVAYEEPYDYGRYAAKVHKLSKRLSQDPCDRVKMLKFAELLLEAGDLQRTVKHSASFHTECGDFPRLRWVSYEANKRMGAYPAALADVDKLIEQWPFDKDFRWWRGEVYERMRDWDRALAEYRQALGLQPKLRSIPFDLARVAERSTSPCEAIFALEQFAFHHPDHQGDPNLLLRLERLYRSKACAGLAGTGSAAIEQDPEGMDVVELRINERVTAKFLIDMESGYSFVSKALADKLALQTAEPFIAWDGAEVRHGQLAHIPSLALDGARTERVAALVVENIPDLSKDQLAIGVEGVLGLTFLTRFALSYRPENGALLLEDKLAPQADPEPGRAAP